MQIFSTFAFVFVFAFSMLQCDSAKVRKSETGKNTATTAQNSSTATAANTPDDGAPRITLEEAKKDFDAGNALFIDTRAEVSYKLEHIKGAINIPVEGFEARVAEVPKDKKVIAYCS